jgi:hypothetical protein
MGLLSRILELKVEEFLQHRSDHFRGCSVRLAFQEAKLRAGDSLRSGLSSIVQPGRAGSTRHHQCRHNDRSRPHDQLGLPGCLP